MCDKFYSATENRFSGGLVREKKNTNSATSTNRQGNFWSEFNAKIKFLIPNFYSKNRAQEKKTKIIIFTSHGS